MTDTRELARWVRAERQQGTDDAVIRGAALDAGWEPDRVDAVMGEGAEDTEGYTLGGPSRLSLVVAGLVLLVLIVSMVVGWLMRSGRI